MKVNAAELTGVALDWAVAKAHKDFYYKIHLLSTPPQVMVEPTEGAGWYWYNPSINWSQGGPIIERIKGFEFKQWLESKPESCCEAHIYNYEGNWVQFGPTPLIAAMRCYVAHKLGDTIDIPEELWKN